MKKIDEKKEIICPECNQLYILEDSDKREYGVFGCPFVRCPDCNSIIYIDFEKPLDVDENSLKYPEHFYSFENGKIQTNEWIEKNARKALKELRKMNAGEFYHIETGDTAIIGLKYEDEIVITVSNKFSEFVFTGDIVEREADYYEYNFGKNEKSK